MFVTTMLRTPTVARRVARVIAAGFSLGVVAGCGSAGVTDAALPADVPGAYWRLMLQDHAINLSVAAPTNTIQLVGTPQDAMGRPVAPVTSALRYTLSDTTLLSVTSDGVLTARGEGMGITVLAELTIGAVTHTDTAVVNVTATAPTSPLTTFSIHPVEPDSAKWSSTGMPKLITPVVADAGGQPMDGLAIAYASRQPHSAAIDPNGLLFVYVASGKALVVASTYAYGVRKADSVQYTIGWPTFVFVPIRQAVQADGSPSTVFGTGSVTIGIGGTIVWINRATPRVLHFDTPSAALESPRFPSGTGDVTLDANSAAARSFMTPGTYRYTDSVTHSTGTVIVRAD